MDNKSILVEFYTNPNDALADIDILIDEDIDVIFVLVDYQMPEVTGAELIRKIKSKYKDLNCLMLSGQANSTQVSELEKDNLLDKFIEKPWDEDELRDAISKLVTAKSISK